VVKDLKHGEFVRIKVCHLETTQPKVGGACQRTDREDSMLAGCWCQLDPALALQRGPVCWQQRAYKCIAMVYCLPAGSDPEGGPHLLAYVGAEAAPGVMHLGEDQHCSALPSAAGHLTARISCCHSPQQ
jgi:hypothetical protein